MVLLGFTLTWNYLQWFIRTRLFCQMLQTVQSCQEFLLVKGSPFCHLVSAIPWSLHKLCLFSLFCQVDVRTLKAEFVHGALILLCFIFDMMFFLKCYLGCWNLSLWPALCVKPPPRDLAQSQSRFDENVFHNVAQHIMCVLCPAVVCIADHPGTTSIDCFKCMKQWLENPGIVPQKNAEPL